MFLAKDLKVKKPVSIMEKYFGCPYCMSELNIDRRVCCGETHLCDLYVLNIDDTVSKAELDNYDVLNRGEFFKAVK